MTTLDVQKKALLYKGGVGDRKCMLFSGNLPTTEVWSLLLIALELGTQNSPVNSKILAILKTQIFVVHKATQKKGLKFMSIIKLIINLRVLEKMWTKNGDRKQYKKHEFYYFWCHWTLDFPKGFEECGPISFLFFTTLTTAPTEMAYFCPRSSANELRSFNARLDINLGACHHCRALFRTQQQKQRPLSFIPIIGMPQSLQFSEIASLSS